MTTDAIAVAFDLSSLTQHSVLRKHRVCEPELAPPEDLPQAAIDAARIGWEDRTRSEYIGTMIMRKLHGLLVDLGAPMDLQELGLVMTLQEQQHANLCAAAARALGSDGVVAFDLPELQQARSRAPLEAQFFELLLGTFVTGEVVAMRLVREVLRVLPASPFADILTHIARDEVLHAHIGPAILCDLRTAGDAAWLPYPGDAWILDQTRACVRAMRQRDVIDPAEAALFQDPILAAALPRLGIPPSDTFKAIYMDALITDVPKALQRAGLDVPDDLTRA